MSRETRALRQRTTAANPSEEPPRDMPHRRRANRIARVLGLATVLLGLTAASASATPSWNATLISDVSDVQAVYVEATAGQFRLSYAPPGKPTGPGVSETSDIAATATATEVRDALNALSNVNEGGGSVSVRIGVGDTNGVNPYLVSFDGGPLRNMLLPLLIAKNGSVALSGNPLGGGPAIAYVATRVPGGVSRSDERIDYLMTVKNTAPVAAGNPTVETALGCLGARPNRGWTPDALATRPSGFVFEWRRNGVVIAGQENPVYVTTDADEGSVIQCLVKGTSANGESAAKYAALPAVVADPQPVTDPPKASNPANVNSRPTITGTTPRTCNAPAAWEGSPSYAFQWLKNGEPIAGEITNQYTPPTLLPGEGFVLQCEVVGTNAGGSLVSVSNNSLVGTVSSPPALLAGPSTTPAIILDASSPVLEFALPAGNESRLFNISSSASDSNNYWSCIEHPAIGVDPPKVVCTTPNVLAPQAELTSGPPPALTPGSPSQLGNLSFGIALGADIPDQASVEASLSGIGTVPVSVGDSFSIEPSRSFGFIPERFSARALTATGDDHTQAGGHPAIASTSLSFNRNHRLVYSSEIGKREPVENPRSISADIPPGFVGNPQAVPELCLRTQEMLTEPSACPPASLVGEVAIQSRAIGQPAFGLNYKRMPLYAIAPERGVPAQFASAETFNKAVYTLTPRLRPGDGYAISIDSIGAPQNFVILDARVTLCGYGANPKQSGQTTLFGSCKQKADPGAYSKPFLTSQTECASAGPVTTIHADSWLHPGDQKAAQAVAPKMTGCEIVPFDPKLDLQPTSNQAESASGLGVDLSVPTDGLEDPDGLSQAHLKKTVVTLPQGMSVNPSAADGLAACTQAELGMANGVPNSNPVKCPNASKIGTALVKTPILEEELTGSVYLAKQGDNPFGTLAAIYLVVESKERGILIKLAGRVDFQPNGQIVSTFDENPQAPISSLELDFHSGPRATLMTPQSCGNYEIVSQLTPWSAADPDNPTAAETVTEKSSFAVTSGPGGGPCPDGSLQPKMNAGLENPLAGSASPFVLRLHRDDGTQRFNGLNMTLPAGLTAKLRGVPYCPDAVLASIPTAEGTGAAQAANPSCPPASQVGSVSVGAGAGNPYYVNTGRAYLAGPYKGAPLSLAVVVPAVAGPFDLGNVVIRNALRVNPVSAQVSVQSDPIPTHVHNVAVAVRDIRVRIDRPDFTLAPTSCEVMAIGATVGGEQGGSANLANRFQVGECAHLGFAPRTNIQLFGGIKRAKYQGVRAVVRPRPGDANIGRTVVRMPRSAFLAQEHIRTVCTRVQFAADRCPKGSIYGRAIAHSPLLDFPLRGNVHLRSSNNKLPDLVADLRGPAHQPIRIELVGRTDSVRGALRNTFDAVPDAPVSYFRLQLFGGKRGLIVNSRDICRGANRAGVRMDAHNGRRHITRPVVRNARCAKQRKAQKRKAMIEKKRQATKRVQKWTR